VTSESIKVRARGLGFDLCGVAPVEGFAELGFLQEWIDRGFAADMDWMRHSASRRADVRELMPEARSVIVTGTLYNVEAGEAGQSAYEPHAAGAAAAVTGSEEQALGTIARYARGSDYHDVLKRRLDALVAWMRVASHAPFDARVYVDTGPVQERVYAQYAGLGWIGKNTCLINPELGSFLFLAEIICTLPLEPDTQGLEQCGSCTRCLDACPTGALVEPGVLDANRCISYLTIENRAAIPDSLRTGIGTLVYGCDICQDVCPFNQVPPHSNDPAWKPRQSVDAPKLAALWRRSDDELRATVRRSAMTRAGLRGLRRNLAVAIGNSGDADAIAALVVPAPESPSIDDPIVQEHVEWALRMNQGR
jgi:epoxyqueuosine reductase